MASIDNHILRLGLQTTKSIRDGDVFVDAESALSNQQDAVQHILRFVQTNQEGTTYTTPTGKSITVIPKLVTVGGALALALCGETAKDALESLIVEQNDPDIQTTMVKEINYLQHDWITDCIHNNLVGRVEPTTATFIQNLIEDAKTKVLRVPFRTPAKSEIEAWLDQFGEADIKQCQDALTNLAKEMTLRKLDDDVYTDIRQQAANRAWELIDKFEHFSFQAKAIQLAYLYSSNLDQWIEVLAWCEACYMDSSISESNRRSILSIMNIKCDRYTYAEEAKPLLEDSLLRFIEQNDIAKLELKAVAILISNKLTQPPSEHLVRNKKTNEQATIACTECGKKIKPSEAITVALLTDKFFCSRECSTAYVMRTKGSLNPRYW